VRFLQDHRAVDSPHEDAHGLYLEVARTLGTRTAQLHRALGFPFNRDGAAQGGASIFILYSANLLGGTLKAGDDAKAARFFGPDELPELAFTSTFDAVQSIWQRQWQRSRSGSRQKSGKKE
jgi:ADP-ribose pyrophosphatase YjhB (NUDIX family)